MYIKENNDRNGDRKFIFPGRNTGCLVTPCIVKSTCSASDSQRYFPYCSYHHMKGACFNNLRCGLM